jgi:hypothetical protein
LNDSAKKCDLNSYTFGQDGNPSVPTNADGPGTVTYAGGTSSGAPIEAFTCDLGYGASTSPVLGYYFDGAGALQVQGSCDADTTAVMYLDATNYSAGSTWFDSSSGGNNATIEGSINYISDVAGLDAVRLENDHLLLPTFNEAFWHDDWTVVFKIRFNVVDSATRDSVFVHHGQTGHNTILHLVERNQKLYFGFGWNDISGTTTLLPNIWYHVVFRSYKGSSTTTKAIFLNNVKEAQHSAAHYQGEGFNTAISKDTVRYDPSRTVPLDAYLNYVLFYDRALTKAEISELYNGISMP